MAYTMPNKAPSANLDYKFDFAPRTNGNTSPEIIDWLQPGETIVDFSLSVTPITSGCAPTITGSSLTDNATSITVWLSGGEIFKEFTVKASFKTSESRQDEKSFKVKIMDH